jgi:hypothetical protein
MKCRFFWFTAILSLFITACEDDTIDFPAFCANFKTAFLKIFPDENSLDGNNLQLKTMFIPSKANMDSVRLFVRDQKQALAKIDTSQIHPTLRTNYRQMYKVLKGLESFLTNSQINPASFNCHAAFHRIMKHEAIPSMKRAEILTAKLRNIPVFYENARKNVKMTTVEQAELAIQHHIKTFNFMDTELPKFIEHSGYLAPEAPKLLNDAKLAIKDYIGFCNSLRAEAARRSVSK